MYKTESLLKNELFSKSYPPQESFFAVTECGYEDFQYREGHHFFRKQSMYTLHFVVKGEGVLHYEGKEIRVRAGNYFSLPPNASFCYYPVKSCPWKYFWLGYTGEFAETYFQKFSQNGIVRTDVKREDSEVVLGDFFTDFFLNKNTGYYRIVSLFFALVDLLSTEEAERTNKKRFYVNEILSCIKLNYANPDFNVDALCKIVHLSHSYLCKLFSGEGITPKAYLTSLRMEEALRLIKSTDGPIKEIAYVDEINFMKAFKKRYGRTPSDFRREP